MRLVFPAPADAFPSRAKEIAARRDAELLSILTCASRDLMSGCQIIVSHGGGIMAHMVDAERLYDGGGVRGLLIGPHGPFQAAGPLVIGSNPVHQKAFPEHWET